MGYTKRIVCLAASLKNGGLCIAGREITDAGFGGWIRPISARTTSELTYLEYRYEDHTSPKLLDLIDVPLLGPSAHGHQTENVLIDTERRWIKRGRAAFRRLKDLSEQPPTLWTNSGSSRGGSFDYVTPAEASQFRWSLCLIQGHKVAVHVVRGMRGERSCRVSFEYNGHPYAVSVTDPLIRDKFEPRGMGSYPLEDCGDIFLCVSLSEIYKPDARCHKLVAAIITDPSFSLV